MKTAEVVRRVEIPAEKLWNAWFYDQEFQKGLYEVFRIVTMDEKLEAKGEWPELEVERTLYFDTDRDIPKPLLKLVRGATKVFEQLSFDATKKEMRVSLRIPVIGRLVDYGYVYAWEDVGDSAMTIHWTGHCDVRIPLVRRLAESYLLTELSEATEAGADFVAEWFGVPRHDSEAAGD